MVYAADYRLPEFDWEILADGLAGFKAEKLAWHAQQVDLGVPSIGILG